VAATDAELVTRALGGSERAFREIVRRYERSIYGLIVRMIRDAPVAEDLAQETFLRAFTRLDTYDRRRPLAAWLFKIAHNLTVDALRRAQPATIPYEDAGAGGGAALVDSRSPTPEEAAAGRELARALEAAIAQLRPAYREVVLLQYREGLSQDEIAEITDLPLGTIKTYLHRARKELAVYLEAAGWAR